MIRIETEFKTLAEAKASLRAVVLLTGEWYEIWGSLEKNSYYVEHKDDKSVVPNHVLYNILYDPDPKVVRRWWKAQNDKNRKEV